MHRASYSTNHICERPDFMQALNSVHELLRTSTVASKITLPTLLHDLTYFTQGTPCFGVLYFTASNPFCSLRADHLDTLSSPDLLSIIRFPTFPSPITLNIAPASQIFPCVTCYISFDIRHLSCILFHATTFITEVLLSQNPEPNFSSRSPPIRIAKSTRASSSQSVSGFFLILHFLTLTKGTRHYRPRLLHNHSRPRADPSRALCR